MKTMEELIINLTIPEQSDVPDISPAIGLREAVAEKGINNPFDLAETLSRTYKDYMNRQENNSTNANGEETPISAAG
jgi:hypothetical protein